MAPFRLDVCMKNLCVVCLSLLVLLCGLSVSAVSFNEVISQSNPSAVLIYADWADDVSKILQIFSEEEEKFGPQYSFLRLNIADKDTKEFNKRYHIYPNLPYILLFKNNGTVSRYLNKDCIMDSSCIDDKFDMFAN